MIKKPPAKQETQVQSLDQADSLEREMAIHSNILAQESHGQKNVEATQFIESDTT